MINTLDHIASTPLFQGLPKEDHEELATVVENRIFNQGELIFSEGDEGTRFLCGSLRSGEDLQAFHGR